MASEPPADRKGVGLRSSDPEGGEGPRAGP